MYLQKWQPSLEIKINKKINLRMFVTGNPPTVSVTSSEFTSPKVATLGSEISSFPVFSSSACLGRRNPSIIVVKIEPGLSEGSVKLTTASRGPSVLIDKS